MKSTTRFAPLLVAVALVVGTATAYADDGQAGPVFDASGPQGEAWVSVNLARHRTGDAYIPLLVAVYNRAGQPVTLDQSSFQLVGADHKALTMPSLQALREDYPKQSFDDTMVRVLGFTGVPFGTRLDERHLVPSSFFPSVSSGVVRYDTVELPNLYWTADVLYFPIPAGFAEGRTATLKIQGAGWEAPLEVTIHI